MTSRARGFRCASKVISMTKTSLAACSLLALCGCAVSPLPATHDSTRVASQAVSQRFAATGRFSAKTTTEQVSGQFRYTQADAVRALNLFSPLGTPIADIAANRDSATLTLANGGVQTAASLSDLLRTVIDLPVTDAMFSAWLQGLPSSAPATVTQMERDAAGLPTRFVEAGWNIVITDRRAAGERAPGAPRRMRWSLAGLPDTEVRWVIDEWDIQRVDR